MRLPFLAFLIQYLTVSGVGFVVQKSLLTDSLLAVFSEFNQESSL